MSTVSDYFGSMVFDDKVMRSMLSADVYHAMKKTIKRAYSVIVSGYSEEHPCSRRP